jgi:hypothetical protein
MSTSHQGIDKHKVRCRPHIGTVRKPRKRRRLITRLRRSRPAIVNRTTALKNSPLIAIANE